MNLANARFQEAMLNNDLALRMKETGWLIDQKRRKAHSDRLWWEINEAKVGFERVSGLALNLEKIRGEEDDDTFDEKLFGSAKQLKELYFNRWMVVPKHFSKETGQASLNKNALKDLVAEGLTPQIRDASRFLLRFRENHKTKSTYVDKLDPENKDKDGEPDTYITTGDGILHATPNVVQAATGRWSFSDPNLQNIQKTVFGDKGPDGKKKILRPGMRDMFVARPGLWLMEGDYAQLELRIIALLAGDEILIDMIQTPGVDMHMENAKVLFGKAEPSKSDRELAKTFVYGSNYGGSAKTIWKQIVVKFPRLTESDVARFQERWFKVHYWIPAWTRRCLQEARDTGRVYEELSGRPFIFYMNQVKPTEPGNYKVQGFAATIMNRATVAIDRELRWNGREQMLAQVHDAAILEGEDRARMAGILRKHMVQTMKIGDYEMKFDVDLKVGTRWGDDLEEYKEAA